ncbi:MULTISPECIES: Hsp20/alpha crystallin family protein [Halobacterium]|uniref:Heat shock protein n=4 Tax=Halobacterium salinarum TaxID=2242 RepID=Q9HSS6_HALSA|nr:MULTISPECIES: Hsp20/alpha crystallin family protein [Halobacterium]AAG18726.1 putative heat shock protein [Halobacterium salinarum NRC-1]MBB6090919.1 HSP20 family protein [Halobacterium salinarum]MCF2164689.1 Hsp20/alpha crystallin family protein [Halobacterium salinarum]MCF2166865.1 Hsp20/alpha crystallin family protein [Halobacterium salinarum]MCF2206387.1 Hsp20/alpha crystallin family protein [Halobacterium salinarum]
MRRDDRDDPFDDIFREIERMMEDMMADGQRLDRGDQSGFASSTHVDVHETEDAIRVIADLPGVEKDDISIQCDGTSVTVSAQSGHREYDERVDLPGRVDAHSGAATYNNGILEVAFDRTESSTNIDVQ